MRQKKGGIYYFVSKTGSLVTKILNEVDVVLFELNWIERKHFVQSLTLTGPAASLPLTLVCRSTWTKQNGTRPPVQIHATCYCLFCVFFMFFLLYDRHNGLSLSMFTGKRRTIICFQLFVSIGLIRLDSLDPFSVPNFYFNFRCGNISGFPSASSLTEIIWTRRLWVEMAFCGRCLVTSCKKITNDNK